MTTKHKVIKQAVAPRRTIEDVAADLGEYEAALKKAAALKTILADDAKTLGTEEMADNGHPRWRLTLSEAKELLVLTSQGKKPFKAAAALELVSEMGTRSAAYRAVTVTVVDEKKFAQAVELGLIEDTQGVYGKRPAPREALKVQSPKKGQD